MILVVGDLLLDLLLLPELREEEQSAGIVARSGGSAANTAAWIAHLGAEAGFVGCVAADALGAMLGGELAASGVDVRLRPVTGAETGCVAVEITAEGERTMRSSRGANAELAPSDIQSSARDGVEWVHVTGYSLLGPHGFGILRRSAVVAQENGAKLSFDPSSTAVVNHFGADRVLAELEACRTWLLLPNAAEARALVGESTSEPAARVLGDRFPLAVVKEGPDGATWSDEMRLEHVPTRTVLPVDTTGAGDAFNAGVIIGLSRGESARDACSLGHSIARRVISQYGGRP
jgi:sugar/nucleoside kinase (ribokinase family)